MSIIALYDMSGLSVRDWAEAGEECFCFDLVNTGKIERFESGGSITFLKWDAQATNAREQVLLRKPQLVIGFPPCTDLAVSGAKHFSRKAIADRDFQFSALAMVLLVPGIAEIAGCPWIVENPVGSLSSLWRQPDKIFNPADFGGYLAEEDQHPLWPQYIAARDAYNKKTCIWARDILWPSRAPVPYQVSEDGFNTQTQMLGGKSAKTKQIRSMTPRGFARALFEANYKMITGKDLPEI